MNIFALRPAPESGTLWIACCVECGAETLIVPTWVGMPRCVDCARRLFGVRAPSIAERRAIPRGASSTRATVVRSVSVDAERVAPVVHEYREARRSEWPGACAGAVSAAIAAGWEWTTMYALAELPADLGFVETVSLRCRRDRARVAAVWRDGGWAGGWLNAGDGVLRKVGGRELKGVLSGE